MQSSEAYGFHIHEEWLAYLKENGYVVIKQVADEKQVNTAIDLFWKHFTETAGARPDDVESWKRWYVDRRGIITDAETIQCEGAWYVRGLPKVKEVFAKIWATDSLIVSMDSLLLWKPWWTDANWTPRTEGLHIDQNPVNKPNLECVQGMVPLYDVSEVTGGLEVIPQSHLPETTQKLLAKYRWKKQGDFCVLAKDDPMQGKGKLLLAKAGDLILWDSRTVHGGIIGTGKPSSQTTQPPQLARMTQTVCMVPRSKASKAVLEKRKEGFLKGKGFTHWPNECEITSIARSGYKPITLTPQQADLL